MVGVVTVNPTLPLAEPLDRRDCERRRPISKDARSLEDLVRRTDGLQPWRRVGHALSGVCMAWIVYALSPESRWPVRLFVGLLAVTLLIDVLRLRSEALNRLFFRVFAVLASPREARRPASFAWYVLGVLLVLWFAPSALVVPSVLVLAFADPAASVVGRLWGKHALGKGTWEGASAFFVTAAAVLIPFAGALVALPTAVLVAATEVLPTGLDDNLMIPVSTAAFLWLLTGLV